MNVSGCMDPMDQLESTDNIVCCFSAVNLSVWISLATPGIFFGLVIYFIPSLHEVLLLSPFSISKQRSKGCHF